MPKYLIISNPNAGSGAGRRAIGKIEPALEALHLDFDIRITERPGHAAELAREAALGDYDVIVAAGGDGTSNEVLNGIMEASQLGHRSAAMGILCAGRGNDFADAVGIPADLTEACRLLATNQRRQIDIGRVTGGHVPQGRYFGNCVGIGFDAIGTIEAAKLPRLGGFFSFLIAVLKTILLYHQGPLATIEYDGQTLTQSSLMISTMNGRRLGGGFLMAPQAEVDDGLFDLCIARQVSRIRILRLIPHFLRGTQASQPSIFSGRASQIKVTAIEGVLPAQADGEIISINGDQLEIELLPRQLVMICPSPGGMY